MVGSLPKAGVYLSEADFSKHKAQAERKNYGNGARLVYFDKCETGNWNEKMTEANFCKKKTKKENICLHARTNVPSLVQI